MLLMNVNDTIVAIIACVLFVVLLTILIFILVKRKKGGTPKVKVDDELISKLVDYLGGESNILSYENDGSRVKFEVDDLSKTNLADLKNVSSGGVFVTGNYVKVPFAYASEDVIKMLNKVLK